MHAMIRAPGLAKSGAQLTHSSCRAPCLVVSSHIVRRHYTASKHVSWAVSAMQGAEDILPEAPTAAPVLQSGKIISTEPDSVRRMLADLEGSCDSDSDTDSESSSDDCDDILPEVPSAGTTATLQDSKLTSTEPGSIRHMLADDDSDSDSDSDSDTDSSSSDEEKEGPCDCGAEKVVDKATREQLKAEHKQREYEAKLAKKAEKHKHKLEKKMIKAEARMAKQEEKAHKRKQEAAMGMVGSSDSSDSDSDSDSDSE